jgi:dTDP-4-dehydrorhamnose reductase
MRTLVTGARGMLGTDLVCVLEERGDEVFATDVEELDITHSGYLNKMIGDICPDVIINCAAYTNVDKAEDEPETAFSLNSLGVQNLALVCRDLDIDFCHISTDYVFDGTKEGPYMPDDSTHPINTYGRSKLAGEKNIQEIMEKFFIIRTSWLYGKYGKNFVYTVLDLAKKQDELKVVDDQWGSPTWTVTLARAMTAIIETKKYGIYHVTDDAAGGISWYEFARKIVEIEGLDVKVMPIKSDEFSQKAKRPQNSVLDLSRTKTEWGEYLPHWETSLRNFLQLLPNSPA